MIRSESVYRFTMLNPNSPIPLYRQLADILLEKIRSFEYPPGSRIPSEHKLAAVYGIGRPTARQATEMLVRKRILTRKRGAGTFVKDAPQEVDLFSLAGTLSSFREKGIRVERDLLAPITVRKITRQPDNPFNNGSAYVLSRLHRANRIPVLVETIYLHRDLFHNIDRFDLAAQSLSHIVAEYYYLAPIGGRQRFQIVYMKGSEARTLDVSSGQPVLLVNRFLHFSQLDNAIYARMHCRTDQFVFSQTLGGTPHG